jgi:superfamily II DNA or RNA helicase
MKNNTNNLDLIQFILENWKVEPTDTSTGTSIKQHIVWYTHTLEWSFLCQWLTQFPHIVWHIAVFHKQRFQDASAKFSLPALSSDILLQPELVQTLQRSLSNSPANTNLTLHSVSINQEPFQTADAYNDDTTTYTPQWDTPFVLAYEIKPQGAHTEILPYLTHQKPVWSAENLPLGKAMMAKVRSRFYEQNQSQATSLDSGHMQDAFASVLSQLYDHTSKVSDSLQWLGREHTTEFVYYTVLDKYFASIDIEKHKFTQDYRHRKLTDTKVWQMLYPFQKDGVAACLSRIEQFGGAILADSVGLGKTLTAMGVVQHYALQGKKVLVLAPKSLKENWVQYKHLYVTNPFKDAPIAFDVKFHSDLTRERGKADDGVDLANFDWHNFGLIVIDESHNFKNTGNGRYKKLMEAVRMSHQTEKVQNTKGEWVEKPMVKADKTKVLCLSATPINNSIRDLNNQFALLTGQQEDCLLESKGIESMSQVIKVLEKRISAEYDKHNSLQSQKTGKDAEISENFEKTSEQTSLLGQGHGYTKDILGRIDKNIITQYGMMLDAFVVARNRSFIEKAYPDNNLQFPLVRKTEVVNRSFLDKNSLTQLQSAIEQMQWTTYNFFKFLDTQYLDLYPERVVKSYNKNMDALTPLFQQFFFKRLESSVYSFQTTVENMLAETQSKIDLCEQYLAATRQDKKQGRKQDRENMTISNSSDIFSTVLLPEMENIERVWEQKLDDVEFQDSGESYTHWQDMVLQNKTKLTVPLYQIDVVGFLRGLQDDKILLDLMLEAQSIKKIDGKQAQEKQVDAKLEHLKNALLEKFRHPFNPNNHKVIVFSNYADTIEYLYEQLMPWASIYGKHIACITGSGVKTTHSGLHSITAVTKDSLLCAFSPLSKNFQQQLDAKKLAPIDIVLATDCISEGQNLQDCDWVISYDVHWNPLRLIQRFGRVNRIGSKNTEGGVQHSIYVPNDDIDAYLGLKNTLEKKQALMSTIDETNLLTGVLKNNVSSLDDMPNSLSVIDLSIDKYRLFLQNYKNSLPNFHTNLHNFPFFWGMVGKPIDPNYTYIVLKRTKNTYMIQPSVIDPYYLVEIYHNDYATNAKAFTHTITSIETHKILAKIQSLLPTEQNDHAANYGTNDLSSTVSNEKSQILEYLYNKAMERLDTEYENAWQSLPFRGKKSSNKHIQNPKKPYFLLVGVW